MKMQRNEIEEISEKAKDSIEKMVSYLHLNNAKSIKDRLNKNNIPCEMSDLRLIFPPSTMYANGTLKEKVDARFVTSLSRRLISTLHTLIDHEKKQRKSNELELKWKVPSTRHWPLYDFIVDCKEEDFWNKTGRECILCDEKINGGSDVWLDHIGQSIHIKNLKKREDAIMEQENASNVLGNIFAFYSSLGSPFELNKMENFQFYEFAKGTSRLISSHLHSIDVIMSKEEIELLLIEIFQLAAEVDVLFLQRKYVSLNSWRDCIEILFRFIAVTKMNNGPTKNQIEIDLQNPTIIKFRKIFFDAIVLNESHFRPMDDVVSYLKNDKPKAVLLKHQFALRSIFIHFGYIPGSPNALHLIKDDVAAASATSIQASDKDAVQMSIEQFENFCSIFQLTYLRCNEDNVKQFFKKSLYKRQTSLRLWQFIEAIGRMSLVAFPPTDLKIRTLFLSSTTVNFSRLMKEINPAYDAKELTTLPSTTSTNLFNKDENGSQKLKRSHLPRESWYPFNQKTKRAEPVSGNKIIFSLPHALSLAKERGEVWLNRMEMPETTTCLSPGVKHIGESMVPISRFTLFNRPRDNKSIAKGEVTYNKKEQKLTIKRRETLANKRKDERDRVKLRVAAREILQEHAGQKLFKLEMDAKMKTTQELLENALKDKIPSHFDNFEFEIIAPIQTPDIVKQNQKINNPRLTSDTIVNEETPNIPNLEISEEECRNDEKFFKNAVPVQLLDESSFLSTTNRNDMLDSRASDNRRSWDEELRTTDSPMVDVNTSSLIRM